MKGIGACTLLGPEGPGRLALFGGWVVLNLSALTSVAGMAVGVGDRPYFENYTVDASILKKTSIRLFLA